MIQFFGRDKYSNKTERGPTITFSLSYFKQLLRLNYKMPDKFGILIVRLPFYFSVLLKLAEEVNIVTLFKTLLQVMETCVD